MPSADGQADVIRRAYAKAGVNANETTYVEVSKYQFTAKSAELG